MGKPRPGRKRQKAKPVQPPLPGMPPPAPPGSTRVLPMQLRIGDRIDRFNRRVASGGTGIRVVLPNPIVDPLLKPGQQPRPLRLLGQDPSKPLPDATGSATDAQPSPGPVPTHADGARKPANTRSTPPAITSPHQRLNQQPSPAPAPNSEDAFDHAELIEDFEYPICQICMGTGWVRDENGIQMVTCDYCEGEGRSGCLETVSALRSRPSRQHGDRRGKRGRRRSG